MRIHTTQASIHTTSPHLLGSGRLLLASAVLTLLLLTALLLFALFLSIRLRVSDLLGGGDTSGRAGRAGTCKSQYTVSSQTGKEAVLPLIVHSPHFHRLCLSRSQLPFLTTVNTVTAPNHHSTPTHLQTLSPPSSQLQSAPRQRPHH